MCVNIRNDWRRGKRYKGKRIKSVFERSEESHKLFRGDWLEKENVLLFIIGKNVHVFALQQLYQCRIIGKKVS